MEHSHRILEASGAVLHHCRNVGALLDQVGVFLRNAVEFSHRTGQLRESGCLLGGRVADLGDKLGFLKATVEFALRRKDLGEPFKVYLKEMAERI